jgi:hypothetical protein
MREAKHLDAAFAIPYINGTFYRCTAIVLEP